MALKSKILFSFFFALFLTLSLSGQENAWEKERNKIAESSLSGGIGFTPFYGNITVNYEAMLIERPDKLFKKRGLRVSTGIYQYAEDGSINVIANYMCLTGEKNNHFELGIGGAYLHFLTISGRYASPAINLGYRFQKPDGKFIFSTGAGFPELLYVRFGFAFN